MNVLKKGQAIWLMGLSGAGKTTLALELDKKIKGGGLVSIILDGDILRSGINRDLGFDDIDRTERSTSPCPDLIYIG